MPNYLLLAAESALSIFGIRSVYEQPPYEVVQRLGADIEIRRYQPRLAAQTRVEGLEGDAATNEGFKRLAGYIFGRNQEKADVAMTSPVARQTSRDIAMTVPVESGRTVPGGMTMRFFLPSKLSLDTAPTPLDSRIEIVMLPAETMAALTFSGRLTRSVQEDCTNRLMGELAAAGWRASGTPVTLAYDPPFTIPFLRRNEIAVAVEAGA